MHAPCRRAHAQKGRRSMTHLYSMQSGGVPTQGGVGQAYGARRRRIMIRSRNNSAGAHHLSLRRLLGPARTSIRRSTHLRKQGPRHTVPPDNSKRSPPAGRPGRHQTNDAASDPIEARQWGAAIASPRVPTRARPAPLDEAPTLRPGCSARAPRHPPPPAGAGPAAGCSRRLRHRRAPPPLARPGSVTATPR